MKRLVCVLCCLCLIFPFLVATAFAVEVQHSGVYDGTGVYFDWLPEGEYSLTGELVLDGHVYSYVSEPVDLAYVDDLTFNVYLDGERYDSFLVDRWSDTFDFEYLDYPSCYVSFDLSSYSEFCGLSDFSHSIKLTGDQTDMDLPVSRPVSPSGFFDFVTSDTMSGALDPLVSLLPVVLGAVVVYIGIRKGIAWISDILHGA